MNKNGQVLKMGITLKDIITLAKELPEAYFEEIFVKLTEIKKKAEVETESGKQNCPCCKSAQIVRNGKNRGKQMYLCRNCKKCFSETSTAAVAHSHSSATVWKQVISDTVDGIPLDQTADSLDLHHETVFNMRHKILYCVEQSLIVNPTELIGVCETDETYVLESEKGRKFPENHHRAPRKHGAKASKPGISNEYVCVCTSVTGADEKVAVSVNRASPDSHEILDVFGERVTENTVILCDGKQSYNILDDKCTVAVAKRINKVNGFHSFIKEKLEGMRGVATIYLNRYNALFSKIYAADKSVVVDEIFELMFSRNDSFNTIAHTQSVNLLKV
jgi:transposase-like protein